MKLTHLLTLIISIFPAHVNLMESIWVVFRYISENFKNP